MAFDAQALWDLSGPITMPSMSDNDFMMLLEKQMQAAHPTSGVAPDAQHAYQLNANLMVSPSAVMAPPPPQPVPADALTPPLTDESSPSPPASDPATLGDGSKRKASRDDGDSGQPRTKVQHKANDEGVNSQPQEESGKKAPTRRKSGGTGGGSEEGRLAKRKEQNRAAQRAFRDRKEKHVRDLEDKIQELEQKFTSSESENTNLKDLLRRLQNENMVLKQSAFTFEFAPADKLDHQLTSPATNTASSLSSGSTNPFTSPSHSGSSASPESSTSNYISKSPNNSLFNTPSPSANPKPNSQDTVTVNSAGFMAFTSPPSTVQPTPATPALSMSSPGAGPSSISQSAFNQNSLFTSYRDTSSSYSLGLPFGDFNTLTAPGIAADFGMDFGMDMSMSSNDLGAFGLGSDFDDLFGGQLGSLDGTSSYGGVGSVASPTATNLMSPQSVSVSTPQSGTTSMAQSVATTPASQPVIVDGLPSIGESARVECSIKAPSSSDWRRCPKTRQDFVELVRNETAKPSTFGPALDDGDKAQIEQDWQQFTKRPEFQDPDMDGLCGELFDKAQCTELKTRMKQSMMRIAKDLAHGQPPA